MENIGELIGRCFILFLFIMALVLQMGQLERRREQLILMQKQTELEQDVGLAMTEYE